MRNMRKERRQQILKQRKEHKQWKKFRNENWMLIKEQETELNVNKRKWN
tara:strand:- start:70 stop:216 length:147 start_codon:yes stop_codon:yes gene_type:complete